MDAIEDECRGKPERITRKILQEWLEGKGLPVTWESLVQTLRETELPFQAKEIAAKVSQSSSGMYNIVLVKRLCACSAKCYV